MNRRTAFVVVVLSLILCGCASAQSATSSTSAASSTSSASSTSTASSASATTSTQGATTEPAKIAHRFATASEGKDLLLSNKAYYAGFSQNDLDFKMQKKGATMDEYQAFAGEQVLEFTDADKKMIDQHLDEMAANLAENGYALPPLDEIVFVKTTMKEEASAEGYTHGTTIYLAAKLLDQSGDATVGGNPELHFRETLWHEIFHCLTRKNPDFRADMYRLIHFTMHDTDFVLPPSVMEYHISNPDVEHQDASAVFSIDGNDVECFCDFVTTRHFEKEGDYFFDCHSTALVPIDGRDVYYTPEQATNFYEVFGNNTDYVVDPEECMAENFAFALTYGAAGKDGSGYKSPEIIEGILARLSR